MEPMATAANLAQAYKARPEGMELISDAGEPPQTPQPDPGPLPRPPAPVQPPVPPQMPPQPPVAPSMPAPAAPSPVAAPSQGLSPAPAPAPVAPVSPVQSVYGSKYDDNARQQLYDSLAKKRGENAGWGLISNVADMNSRVGGGTPLNAYKDMNERQVNEEKTAKGDFEAGRESKLKDATANIALAKENRAAIDDKEKGDPTSQASRLATGFASQMLGPEKAAKMGWVPGKSSYDDVIKVLPIIEKSVALEIAKSNKDITLGTKKDQFNETLTTKLRGQIENHPVYKNYMTLHGATEQAKRAIENPSAYGDLSLIYSTIKGLDAQSSVREGEVKTMAEMASLKNRLLGSLQTVANGQHLTASQKADAKNVIASMEKIARDNVLSTAAPILAQSKRAGLQENEINPLYQAPTAPAGGQPIAAGWKVVR